MAAWASIFLSRQRGFRPRFSQIRKKLRGFFVSGDWSHPRASRLWCRSTLWGLSTSHIARQRTAIKSRCSGLLFWLKCSTSQSGMGASFGMCCICSPSTLV